MIALVAAWIGGLATVAGGQSPARDILWHIVSACIDPSAPEYCARCASPIEGQCPTSRECRRTTEVWAATPDYVAIRDIKMCGCGRDFVHGLALPRQPVAGLEDPRRPAGIWSFAWGVARQRIADEGEIALVVNPPSLRTQDQLHIHLVRLKSGVRASLAADSVRVQSLDDVWEAAARRRAEIAADSGVLVARDGDRFLVFAGSGPLEQRFTLGECR